MAIRRRNYPKKTWNMNNNGLFICLRSAKQNGCATCQCWHELLGLQWGCTLHVFANPFLRRGLQCHGTLTLVSDRHYLVTMHLDKDP